MRDHASGQAITKVSALRFNDAHAVSTLRGAFVTVQLQFIRYDEGGEPIILDSVTFPVDDLRLAKAKAQSIAESSERDPHIQAARIVDRFGSELYAFRIEPQA